MSDIHKKETGRFARYNRALPTVLAALALVIAMMAAFGGGPRSADASPASSDALNVKADCGAVGNGTTDDTLAFQNCVAAAVTQNVAVYVPWGRYKITGTIVLKDKLMFGESEGAFVADNQTPTTPTLPTILLSSTTASGIRLDAGGAVSGLNFDYPAQNENSATPNQYPPTISVNGVGTRISNVHIQRAWIGIQATTTSTADVNTGRQVIQDVFIDRPAYRGIVLDGGYDAGTFDNIEVWTPQNTYCAKNAEGVCTQSGHFTSNGIGIVVKHEDAFRLSNTLVFGASVGVQIQGTSDGEAWGTLTGVTTDYCAVGIDVVDKNHVTLSGVENLSLVTALRVQGDDSHVTVSGSGFRSNASEAVYINGGNYVTISSSNIERRGPKGNTPALSILSGAKAVVTGNNVSNIGTSVGGTGPRGVYIGSLSGVVLVAENLIVVPSGGVPLTNAGTNPFSRVTGQNILYP